MQHHNETNLARGIYFAQYKYNTYGILSQICACVGSIEMLQLWVQNNISDYKEYL